MAEETRGVFTLKTVRNNILNDEFVTPDQAFFAGFSLGPSPNTAYTCGSGSIVDKTTFSDGTTSRIPGANLTIARSYPGSVGSMIYGYVNGGWSPAISTLERITYSSDTTAAVPGANGVVNRYAVKAAGNTTDGYWGGGSVPGVSSIIDRLSYASETYSRSPATLLSQAKYHLQAAGTSDAGFFMGGSTDGSNVLTEVDKLTYAAGTTSRLPGANLPQTTAGWAASAAASPRSISSGGVYYAGGRLQSNGPHTSNVSKMTYSAETTSLLPTTLSAIRYIADGTGNSTHGYFTGGSDGASGQSTVDKWDFSNDTTGNLPSSGNLSSARSGHTSFSAKEAEKPEFRGELQESNLKGESDPNTGYTGGGYNGSGAVSTVNKLYFATDSMGSVPASSYSLARYYVAGTGSLTAGYGGGGRGGVYSTMDKTTYATDSSAAVPAATLSSARYGCSALGTKEFGYFAGGTQSPPNVSLTDRITYATDARALVPGANLTEAGNFQSDGGSGNQSKGYVSGFPSTQNKIDRFEYSTETFSTLPQTLSSVRPFLTTVSNSKFGYFAGGNPGLSTVDKLDFSTETFSASFPLSQGRSHQTSTGNESNAYIIGSQNPGRSSTEKISYTTDSPSLIPGANTPTSTLAGAAGNSAASQGGLLKKVATPTLSSSIPGTVPNTGYFGGGDYGPDVSTMDKVAYSTDTTAQIPGASLSVVRYYLAATASTTAGYFGGGANPSGAGDQSTMDKLTYSSDTTAAVPGAALSQARFAPAATGSTTAGYFGGGGYSPVYTTVDKVTYASDTTAQVPGASLSLGRGYLGAAGNQTVGYFGGGFTPGPSVYSTMDKTTYSSDTTAVVPSAPLSVARDRVSATGNSTTGYFGGGNPGPLSTVDKLTYSIDTTAAVPSAPLTAGRYAPGATGNLSSGYFGGGASPGSTYYSTMDKVNYSSDTTAQVPGANLSLARYGTGASSARANVVGNVSNVL